MTTIHGRYDFCTDITATIFGIKDKTIVMFHDFECEVEVEIKIFGDAIEATCTDVLIEGKSMRNGDKSTKALFGKIANLAESEIAAAGPLWDRVQAAEGVSFHGAAGDPDGHWQKADR